NLHEVPHGLFNRDGLHHTYSLDASGSEWTARGDPIEFYPALGRICMGNGRRTGSPGTSLARRPRGDVKSFAAGLSKSMSFARPPRVSPLCGSLKSTSTPSVS